MKWLTRMEVDAETVRAEHIVDAYVWHKRLWECFPNAPDKKRDFLTRIDTLEGGLRLWLLARDKPVRPSWCKADEFASKEILQSFLFHKYYAFDLMVNPVKKLVQRGADGETLFRPNGKRKQGKRVPLVKEEELRAWLVRKGEARCRDMETGKDVPGGFKIIEEKPLEISPMVENHFCKTIKQNKQKQAAYHGGVQFRGTLEVTDRKNFIKTYEAGIGSAKSFGFGLWLLAPVNL